MKRIHAATIAAMLITSTPAMAQWNYDPAQAVATSYCAAMAAGKSEREADNIAKSQLAFAAGGGFSSTIATVITGGSSAMERARYIARQMCPQYFLDQLPPFPIGDGQ
jgi:hypothetical protein